MNFSIVCRTHRVNGGASLGHDCRNSQQLRNRLFTWYETSFGATIQDFATSSQILSHNTNFFQPCDVCIVAIKRRYHCPIAIQGSSLAVQLFPTTL